MTSEIMKNFNTEDLDNRLLEIGKEIFKQSKNGEALYFLGIAQGMAIANKKEKSA